MKKNILLVHSLLVLPLLTPSFALCSENNKRDIEFPALSYQPSKDTQLPLKNSGSYKKNRKPKRAPQVIEKAIETNVLAPVEQIEAAAPVIQVACDEQIAPQKTVVAKAPSKYLSAELSPEEAIQAKHDLEKAKSYSKNMDDIFSVIRTITDNDKGLRHVAKAPSKYLGAELSPEEAIQAKHNLEKAKSYSKNMDDIFSVIRTITDNDKVLRHVETVTTTQEMVAPIQAIQIILSEDLEKSVMNPAESKGFGFTDKLFSVMSSYTKTVIRLLGNGTFEPSNATHKNYFNNALEECAAQKNMSALSEIMSLCQKEQYKPLQSSLNHVAPAFNLISEHFATKAIESNKNLIKYNEIHAFEANYLADQLHEKLVQLLNEHSRAVTAISEKYKVEVDNEQKTYDLNKKLLAGVCALNAKAKEYENNILFAYPLMIPTNKVAAIEHETYKKSREVLSSKNMPRAKTDFAQLNSILQLTDK